MIQNMIVDLHAMPSAAQAAEPPADSGIVLSNAKSIDLEQWSWIARNFGWRWPKEAAAGWNWFARNRSGLTVGFASYEQRKYRWWWLRAWLGRKDVGIFGPMGVDPSLRGLGIGAVLLRRALASLRDAGFSYALIGAVGPVLFYERVAGAKVVERLRRTLFGVRRESLGPD